MKTKIAPVAIILTAALCLFLGQPVSAIPEKEPNNMPEEANRIQLGETLEGLLQDGYDYYAITLPATGQTTITLTGCPRGGQVQLGAKNFGYTGWQDSNGEESVSLTFDAQKTDGFIWVAPTFAGSVCGNDWCASQFVAGEPFHITKDSPHAPGAYEGKPIMKPVAYKLIVSQAATQTPDVPSNSAPEASAEHSTARESASQNGWVMKRLYEDRFGFSFELPDHWVWELLPDKGGYLLSGPAGTEENEVIIVVQAVQKATNPGSSETKQLQEARTQIEGIPGAEIRSEDAISVSGRQVPYFLALYPGQTAKKEPATFAHVQLVLEYGAYYFWISYAAPTQYFEKFQDLFANMLVTFEFSQPAEPNTSKAPPPSSRARGQTSGS